MKINNYEAVQDIKRKYSRENTQKKAKNETDINQKNLFNESLIREKKNKDSVKKTQNKISDFNIGSVNKNSFINNFSVDKGTAAHTTVYVSKSAYDRILSATTHSNRKPDWEEMGCDGEKRWVVINGQRFESPLSQAEKDKIKNARLSLLDILMKNEKNKTDNPRDPRGNIESLKNNKETVLLLNKIFGTSSFDELMTKISMPPKFSLYV